MNNLIIIPTYNEKQNIEELINKIIEIDKDLDILVVDGNSQDGTREILNRLRKEVPNVKVIYEKRKEGLAKAYIKGFKYALTNDYKIILQMDADFQHSPEYIPKLLEKIKSCDIVLASRDLSIKNLLKPIPVRVKISILANLYINLMTGMRFDDCLGGYKCYRKKVLKSLNLDLIKSRGFIFQSEILYLIWKKGHKIKEIPIIFGHRRTGHSKISPQIFMEGFLKVLLF